MIVRKLDLLRFFRLEHITSVRQDDAFSALKYLVEMVKTHESDKDLRHILRVLCRRLVDHNASQNGGGRHHYKLGHDFLASIVEGSLLLNDVQLCNDSLKAFPKLDAWALVAMSKMIEKHSITKFEEK